MKIFKKIAAFLAAAVMAVTAVSVTAGAEYSFDDYKVINSGDYVHDSLNGSFDPKDYKIKVGGSGTLKINYLINLWLSDLIVYDAEGIVVPYNSLKIYSGSDRALHYGYVTPEWNEDTEQCSFSTTYKVKKGTYYIRILTEADFNGSGAFSFTAEYPTTEATKIDYLTVSLKKGSSLELGAALSGSGEVSWSSSKKAVASVDSDGIVTAKKKGSAIITAKCGTSSKKIKIIVK